MVDNMVDKQSSTEVTESGFTSVKLDPMAKPKLGNKSSGSALVWVLLILVLFSLGVSGYLWQQLQHVSGDVLKGSVYQLDFQKNQQAFSELQKSLNETQAKLSVSEAALAALGEGQQQVKLQIASISGVNRVDWLVDELQHLTRLAHQRLVLSHDANGAIALLKAADQVVIEMRQSSALAVRQAIAKDLLQLKSAANVDLEGAYIRLDALGQKIETLSFKKPRYPNANFSVDEGLSEQADLEDVYYSDSYTDRLARAGARISTKLRPYLYRSFTIEDQIKPLLSGDERQYLARNMQLAIEEAQLALLRREPESYRLSLEQSEKWVKQYYDLNDPATTTILMMLEELKSYRLSPKMPEIDATLDAVKTFADSWQQEKLNKPKLRRSLGK